MRSAPRTARGASFNGFNLRHILSVDRKLERKGYEPHVSKREREREAERERERERGDERTWWCEMRVSQSVYLFLHFYTV